MVAKYLLHRDTFGFIETTMEIVTIPAGAAITVEIRGDTPVGLCNVEWQDRTIQALLEDVQRNGSVICEATTA